MDFFNSRIFKVKSKLNLYFSYAKNQLQPKIHAHKIRAILFFILLSPSSYLWLGPQSSFIPNSKKTLFYKLKPGRLSCLSPFSSFHACSLPTVSTSLPSARFSGYSGPDVYYKGSGVDKVKQNVLMSQGRRKAAERVLQTVGPERYCEHSSNLTTPAFQIALSAFP